MSQKGWLRIIRHVFAHALLSSPCIFISVYCQKILVAGTDLGPYSLFVFRITTCVDKMGIPCSFKVVVMIITRNLSSDCVSCDVRTIHAYKNPVCHTCCILVDTLPDYFRVYTSARCVADSFNHNHNRWIQYIHCPLHKGILGSGTLYFTETHAITPLPYKNKIAIFVIRRPRTATSTSKIIR